MAAAVVAEGEQQVPGRPKVPGELQSDWIGRGAISGASDIDLGEEEKMIQITSEQRALK